jgi:hypothetical protein
MLKKTLLIVDEVDNMIVDGQLNTTYIYDDEPKTRILNEFFNKAKTF